MSAVTTGVTKTINAAFFDDFISNGFDQISLFPLFSDGHCVNAMRVLQMSDFAVICVVPNVYLVTRESTDTCIY